MRPRRALAGPLKRVTPYTITQPARLRDQLARILVDGYATTIEEMSLGACSAAVPIQQEETVIAALGIVVPSLKRDKARLTVARPRHRPQPANLNRDSDLVILQPIVRVTPGVL